MFLFFLFLCNKSVAHRQEYQQGKQLQKMQDYLVCMTESTVSRAVYDIKDFMTQVQHEKPI